MKGRLVAVLAGSLLALAACSDDDDGTSSEADRGVCPRVEVDALARATGLRLDAGEPEGRTTCTFTTVDGPAIVGFSYTALDDVTATEALEAVRASCDPGTDVDVTAVVGDGAFGCEVQGEVTVAAAGGGHLAVLAGVTLDRDVPASERFHALGAVADRALQPGEKT